MKKFIVGSIAALYIIDYVGFKLCVFSVDKENDILRKQVLDTQSALTASLVLLQAKGVDVKQILTDAQFNNMTANLDI